MTYVINELSSEVAVFRFDLDAAQRVIDTKVAEPTLHLVQMISTLPVAYPGQLNTCGRITVHSSGRFVLVSNRGHDSIAVFAVQFESSPPGLLAVKSISHTRGSCPRHFAFDSSGMWLAAANQVCCFFGRIFSFGWWLQPPTVCSLPLLPVGKLQDSDSINMFNFNISTGDLKYTGNSNSLHSPNFVCFLDPRTTLPRSPLPRSPILP
jgi:6-phosphogluconolactonase (cycloisomerase 2 family)